MGKLFTKKGPQPYNTPAQKLAFAITFLSARKWDFKKNLDICLTAKANKRNKQDHAYMPGLLITVAFLDLLSGLYVGDVENHGEKDFIKYGLRFLPKGRYTEDELRVLYKGFRNKIAHLSHPYFVMDTHKGRSKMSGPQRRITWRIYAAPRKGKRPIEIEACPGQYIRRQPTPGRVEYDHRVHISIASLARDARNSLRGKNGYVKTLRATPDLQRKFERCMGYFYAL